VRIKIWTLISSSANNTLWISVTKCI
jgi:hypothetical protein